MSEPKVTTKTAKATTAAAKPATKPATAQTTPKPTKAAPTLTPLQKEEAKLRTDLSQARRDHALQKLESPAKLRTLRRQLARVMTAQANKESA